MYTGHCIKRRIQQLITTRLRYTDTIDILFPRLYTLSLPRESRRNAGDIYIYFSTPWPQWKFLLSETSVVTLTGSRRSKNTYQLNQNYRKRPKGKTVQPSRLAKTCSAVGTYSVSVSSITLNITRKQEQGLSSIHIARSRSIHCDKTPLTKQASRRRISE